LSEISPAPFGRNKSPCYHSYLTFSVTCRNFG